MSYQFRTAAGGKRAAQAAGVGGMTRAVTATEWLIPKPTPRRHLEDDLQRAVMQFLDHALGARGMAYAIPNGGKRHAREAARMKGLGVKPGVPDIGICVDGRALFVELKAPRGVVSDAQKDMARRLHYAGGVVMLCRSVEDVEAQLREACIPLRAGVAA